MKLLALLDQEHGIDLPLAFRFEIRFVSENLGQQINFLLE